MLLRTANSDWIICPGCGEKHGECADWVKSMPHREICSCGAEMLCWSETETTYHAEIVGPALPKEKTRKKKDKKRKKKEMKKRKKKKKG